MTRRTPNRVWVRGALTKTVIGTATDTVAALSLRSASNSPLGVAPVTGLSEEFTVVRLLAWIRVEEADSSGAITNPSAQYFGAKVADRTELTEWAADANYRSANGPFSDDLDNWLAWTPVYPENPTRLGTSNYFSGKAMVDIRAARRCDSLEDDLAIMLDVGGVAAASTIQRSIRVAFAALCVE